MKKLFMAMAAVAMLCAGLTSCSSDIDEITENETPKQEITFDFNFSAAGDAETRATQKTAWEANDVIYVGFNGQLGGLLKFTYDGTSWSTPETYGTLDLNAVANASSKKCMAFWVEGNPGNDDIEFGTPNIIKFAKNGRCYLFTGNEDYTYDSNTNKLSASFKLHRENYCVKIAVSGLGEDTWQICAKELQTVTSCYSTNGCNVSYYFNSGTSEPKTFKGGNKIGDETCFYAEINDYVSSPVAGSVIYLKKTVDGVETIYRKQFSGKKLSTMKGKTINITFSESTWTEISAEDFAALTSDNMDVMPTTLNGHEYVDLGLPSGTKWATCNIGASSPTAYGDYYAFGETSTKTEYTESNSATYRKTLEELKTAGYIDDNNNLVASYDAATANWGSTWRMPTNTELEELVNNCTWTWKDASNTDYNGVVGYEVTSSNGKSIFLPAAGRNNNPTSTNTYAGQYGYYMSSTAYDDGGNAYNLQLTSWNKTLVNYVRYAGCTIRPVTK